LGTVDLSLLQLPNDGIHYELLKLIEQYI